MSEYNGNIKILVNFAVHVKYDVIMRPPVTLNVTYADREVSIVLSTHHSNIWPKMLPQLSRSTFRAPIGSFYDVIISLNASSDQVGSWYTVVSFIKRGHMNLFPQRLCVSKPFEYQIPIVGPQ